MNKKHVHHKLSHICRYGLFSLGLKNEFETAVVNEPSVFEPLKFYCIWKNWQGVLIRAWVFIKINTVHVLLYHPFRPQGPVVKSILSLTSSLKGQLVKLFTTLLPNTLIVFVEKMRIAFHIFSTKNIGLLEILMFEILTKMLTNDIVSFEQVNPD